MKNRSFTVDLGPEGGSQEFPNIDAAIQWISKEVEFWSWIQKPEHHSNWLKDRMSEISSGWESLSSLMKKEQSDDMKAAISNQFSRIYREFNFPISSTPIGQYLTRLSTEDIDLALAALFYVLNPNEIWSYKDAVNIAGQFRILQFRNPHSNSETEAFRQAIIEKDNEARIRIEQTENILTQATENAEKFSSYASRLSESELELSEGREKRFDETLEQNRESLLRLEKTYDEKLALERPVRYWSKKANKHNEHAKYFGRVFGASLSSYILVVVTMVYFFLIPHSPDPFLPIESPEVPIWMYGFIIGLAAVLIWPVRIFSRLMLSNLHLCEDAKERSTMAQTYLSLLRYKEAGMTEKDRQLILVSLFRPTNLGIVKDDAAPASFTNIIQSVLSGDRK